MTREALKALDTVGRLLHTCDQIANIVALGQDPFEEHLAGMMLPALRGEAGGC